MEAEKSLVNNFYAGFWLFLVLIIVGIIIVVFLIIFRNKLLSHFNQATMGKVVFISIIGLLILINVFFSVKFTTYCLDLNAVQNRNFETITGTVVGYTKSAEAANGTIDYSGPIIRIEGTGETIRLNVAPTELNKTYTFIYLKHTKLAKIKAQI